MEQTLHYGRHVVIVFVDDFDPSAIAALGYARGLRPTALRAVHFVIDGQQAERLRAAWQPDRGIPLKFVECPDRGWPGAPTTWSATRRNRRARR